MSEWITKLNKLSLKDFSALFASSAIYNISGYYRATFVGPGWLRATAGPTIAVGGLGNWWGKHIKEDGTATNLVQQEGSLKTRFSMQLINTTSVLDGKPALALIYGADNRFPWPYVVDELRALDPLTFLGMTHVNAGALRKLAFPFLLQYQEQVDGLCCDRHRLRLWRQCGRAAPE
jgi:hypothetical protein